ncbi:MAG: hypothetical protein H6747_04860, partial [Deltaproteobacteria bacterium]|nr:hypothetical protein [Deltaproteobacteria bacterium]
PPHTTSSEPKNGGVLHGRTVTVHGYSLDYADRKAEVRDITAGRAIHAAVEVDCRWEGKGDCNGCQQQKCEAKITLAETTKDHQYRITYLDLVLTVQAADTARGKGDARKPEPSKPEPAKPEPAKPQPAKPQPAKPAPPQPDTAKKAR